MTRSAGATRTSGRLLLSHQQNGQEEKHLDYEDSVYIPLPEEDSNPGQPIPPPEAPKAPAVRDVLARWIIQIKGEDAIKVAGLIHLAHRSDITGLTLLSLKAIPVHITERFAVSQATAIFQDAQGNRVEFSDLADACPGNVNQMVAAHFIRVSATRAIGRYLRWALNVEGNYLLLKVEAVQIGDSPPAPLFTLIRLIGRTQRLGRDDWFPSIRS